MDAHQLFDLRFEARDRELEAGFLRVKQEMNGRGLLQSSITVQKLHEVARKEFEGSQLVIVETVVDALSQSLIQFDRQRLENLAQQTLEKRKKTIEGHLHGQNATILRSLQNESMTAQYVTLDQYNSLAVSELSIKLARALDGHQLQSGATEKDRIVNALLNNRIIAVLVIVTVAALAIFGLVSAVKEIVK